MENTQNKIKEYQNNKYWINLLSDDQYLIGAKVNGIKTEFHFEKNKIPQNYEAINFGLDLIQSQYPESLVEFDFIRIV